jgi:hypothetical protein
MFRRHPHIVSFVIEPEDEALALKDLEVIKT